MIDEKTFTIFMFLVLANIWWATGVDARHLYVGLIFMAFQFFVWWKL